MEKILKLILFLFLIEMVLSDTVESQNMITKLRKDLLTNYDPHSRPVQNHRKNTSVSVDLAPLHLTELDELRGIMTMEAYLDLEWQDPLLVWIPEKYDGIKTVHFHETEIWKPDITVYESVGTEVDPWHNVYLIVNSSGFVSWNPPATLNTICHLDFTDYPRDVQECTMTVGSWSYHGEHIDLHYETNETHMANMFLTMENNNPNWEVLSVVSSLESSVFEEFEQRKIMQGVEYTIKIRRRGLAEEDMVALPRGMSLLLILMMFMVPQGLEYANTKMVLGFVPLLIQTILIFLVAMNVPAVACLTNGLRALKTSFTLSALAILAQVSFLNLSACNGCSPPEWLMKLLSPTVLKYLLCFCGGSPSTSTTMMQDDGTTRVVESMDPRKKDWLNIASALDRLALFIFLFLFLVTGAFW